jgi:hypothetical protein
MFGVTLQAVWTLGVHLRGDFYRGSTLRYLFRLLLFSYCSFFLTPIFFFVALAFEPTLFAYCPNTASIFASADLPNKFFLKTPIALVNGVKQGFSISCFLSLTVLTVAKN